MTSIAGECLTEREVAMLRLAADGLTDAEIGQRLSLAPQTVSNGISRTFGKLGALNRVHAVVLAQRGGWLKL